MFSKLNLLFLYVMVHLVLIHGAKKPSKINMTKQSAKFENPNFVRDRFQTVINKPEKPDWWKKRHRLPFNSAWMDYCDPYHCNDYHKTACGLNRKSMRFKWFQSKCHIIINNMCSTYRGTLKYDAVDPKFCLAYVMLLRSGCEECQDTVESPVCGMSVTDYHAVLFRNKCALKKANCDPATLNEYKEVEMQVCTLFELFTMNLEHYHPEEHRLRL